MDASSSAAERAEGTSPRASATSTNGPSSLARGTPSGPASASPRRRADSASATSALSQPQLGQARLRFVAVAARPSVRRLRLGQPSLQPVELAPHVEGRAERRLAAWLRQPFTGPFDLTERLGPQPAEQHQLGAVDQALPAVQDQLGLGGAPTVQRLGPLLGPPHVEHLLTALDRRAVQVTHRRGSDVLGADHGHGLVEHGQAAPGVAGVDQAPPQPHPRQRCQLEAAEPLSEPGGLPETRDPADELTFHGRPQRGAIGQVPLLDAVEPGSVQDASRALHPATSARELAAVHEGEGQPERAACGTRQILRGEPRLVGALPGPARPRRTARRGGRRWPGDPGPRRR